MFELHAVVLMVVQLFKKFLACMQCKGLLFAKRQTENELFIRS